MLQVGDKMPSFAAADETGKMVTDKDLIGKKQSFISTRKTPLRVVRLKHVTFVTTTMLSWHKGTKSSVSAKIAKLRISSSKRNTTYLSRSSATLQQRCCKPLAHGVRKKTMVR